MAMVGKRFQRTTSMSQIGPAGSQLQVDKARSQKYYQQQELGEVGEQPPAKQWEILKNAEAMMMKMMATSGGGGAASEELLGRQTVLNMPAVAANETEPPQHLRPDVYSCSRTTSCAESTAPEHQIMSSPAVLILPTHHFLDACFYCNRRLRPERDIFIYRGDAAFCTEECRDCQILSDETH